MPQPMTPAKRLSRQEEANMARIFRVAAIVVAACAGARTTALASDSPTLAIRVIDYAHASAVVLVEAEHHVMRVFGTAGVNVSWREGEAAFPANTTAQVTVLILSDTMATEKVTKEHLPAGVLATAAPPPAHRAWIFLRRVQEAAELQDQSPGLALGRVIAHEIAHMVANVEHSANGVMASALHLKDGLQGFTHEQGERIRAAIQMNSDAVILARDRARTFQPSGR
jgi:hypothetical protein